VRRRCIRTGSWSARSAAVVALFITLAQGRLASQQVVLENAFPALSFADPVGVVHPDDGTNRLFVVRRSGRIEVVENAPAVSSAKTFLDIDSLVISGSELGLLGLAFHPSYESNGYFYVNYTADSSLRTVVSRFTVSGSNPDSADPASELVLLEVHQPYNNHNGGQLAFGPDGYLYIALGDGGSGGDPENRAQNLDSLLGKILRIDVDAPSDTLDYSIPPDNPLAGNTDGYREEIFAWGLRNPWRFSFDPVTGIAWIGDVGQGEWEEVDTMVAGGNYGWRLMEGNHCYTPPSGCDTVPGLIDPVWEYPHGASGGCSITGGFVYRGGGIPWLRGKYVFGDYCNGRIWAIDTNGSGEWTDTLLLDAPYNISSFGADRDGELYFCSLGNGVIYRLTPAYPPEPLLLSPPDGAINLPPNPELGWSASPTAIRYHLQVAGDTAFAGLLLDDTTVTDTVRAFPEGPAGATYHWRVRAGNSMGWSPFTPPWSFSVSDTGSTAYLLARGWNLVSLPLDPADGTKDSVFPSAISQAFAFEGDTGYSAHDSLVPGRGYWLKFQSAEVIPIAGEPRYEDTVDVLPGWNLIGGISVPVDVDSIAAEPPGIIASAFFGYDGSYFPTPAIEPVRGYWVKLSGAGVLILRGGAGSGVPGGTMGGTGRRLPPGFPVREK
jgi:glucose/arabinose dehydrogenase